MTKCPKKVYVRKVLRSRIEQLNCRSKIRNQRRSVSRELPMKNREIFMKVPMEQNIGVEVKDLKPSRKVNGVRFYNCCVPNCLTYGPSDQFVSFPSSDSDLRRLWLDVIPRKNWFVCHSTLICRKHFNGEERITENDVPALFSEPKPPNLEDKYRRIDKGMFQISNYVLPETFGDLALLPNCDKFIFDFFTLTSKYQQHLSAVLEACKWMTQLSCSEIIFYQIYWVGGCVKVSTSIIIDSHLKATIALEGIIMDPLDYTRHIPVHGRITHWNQLNLMLLDYGYDRQNEIKGQVVPLTAVKWNVTNAV